MIIIVVIISKQVPPRERKLGEEEGIGDDERKGSCCSLGISNGSARSNDRIVRPTMWP